MNYADKSGRMMKKNQVLSRLKTVSDQPATIQPSPVESQDGRCVSVVQRDFRHRNHILVGSCKIIEVTGQ